MVEGGRKEVNGDQPATKQLSANLLAKGPLGAQNLRALTEGIREDVETARVPCKGEEWPELLH